MKRPQPFSDKTFLRGLKIEIHDLPDNKGATLISGTEGDLWSDFGTMLEALSFMVTNVAHSQGKAPDEVVDYVVEYLKKGTIDYKIIDS